MGEWEAQVIAERNFQGKLEKWSNVVRLETAIGVDIDPEVAADALVNVFKSIYSSEETISQVKIYGVGGLPAQNAMRIVKDYTTVGTMPAGPAKYIETCVLIHFVLPRSSTTGRKRVARKWLHGGYLASAGSPGVTVVQGSAVIPQTTRDYYFNNLAVPLRDNLFGGARMRFNGDAPTNTFVHPYVEHRQFRRGRKRT